MVYLAQSLLCCIPPPIHKCHAPPRPPHPALTTLGSDHEKQRKREAEMRKIAAAADPLAAAQASAVMPEAAALYRHAGDLSLKEGQTIK